MNSSAFASAKAEFETAKSLHESAQAEFKSLKAQRDQLKKTFDALHAEHIRCKNAFQSKLEEVKADNQRKRDKILDKAKIYGSARKDAKIVEKADKTVQIYHGGLGKGDGLGHGHTAIDETGEITYSRKAFDSHGKQNFVDLPLKNGRYHGTIDGCPAIIKVSDAGNSNQVQVFYGGKGSPDGLGHNHINVTKDTLRFWRENGQTIYEDDKNNQINDL